METTQEIRGRPLSVERKAPVTPPSLDVPRSDGIRDTIESIVVAFILAFVFRAFMVEAFVIPTGSMAPGLFGQHVYHRCSLCQYPFAYGIREDQVYPSGAVQEGTLSRTYGVRCPNCGFEGAGNSSLNTDEDRVSASAGDRILVLKWPYDLGGELLGPKRWDVVVFKDPEDGDTNFIKRLIGLPGEVVQIINGDIYAAPFDDVPEAIRRALENPPQPWNPDSRRLTAAQYEQLAALMKIQRKTRVAQASLWMLHYDHDYQPDPTVPFPAGFEPPRWEAEDVEDSAWEAAGPIVRYEPRSNDERWLRLAGRPIEDDYGYNNVSIYKSPQKPQSVGDVLVNLALIPGGAKGHVKLYLSKGPDEFEARIDSDGTVVLTKLGLRGAPIELQRGKIDALVPHRAVTIEFENVDYRVSLRVNDAEVVATTDIQYSPDPVELVRNFGSHDAYNKAAVRIGAKDMPLEIRHLGVLRDVYYRSDFTLEERSPANKRNPFAHYPGWGTTLNPILLRSDPPDFYCLGDNSPQSKDSRLWWEICPMLEQRGDYRYGTVPGDQLIGKAFFVYWPSGYRLSRETPAVIPNVGRMRIIR